MADFLRSHIHMAVVGTDVVLLDTQQDTYFCLVGAAEFLRLGSDGEVETATANARSALEDAGLISPVPRPSRRRIPDLPSRSGSLVLATAPTHGERLRFFKAASGVLQRYRGSPFATLISDHPHYDVERVGSGPSGAMIRHAALFARWLPWVPYQETCLYRAFLLRRFLASAGLHADWVFGVATWPFSAHCWLQAGNLVLDDDVDRVRSYSPIMVV